MDRSHAIALLRETFNRRFEAARYLSFVRCLVKQLDVSTAKSWTPQTGAFASFADGACRMGTYVDPRGAGVDVLVLYLKKDLHRSEGRLALRNFIADYLSVEAGQGRAALLFACVSPDAGSWRFSFGKLANDLESPSPEFSADGARLRPARCASYLAGAGLSGGIAPRPLLALLKSNSLHPTVDAIDAAFSRDRLAKDFCDDYRNLFLSSRAALTDEVTRRLLEKTLFLYFLRAMGRGEELPWSEEGEAGAAVREVFERYPFTLHESEALDKEIALDPEILGKVFEDFLPENSRHASGTYYTPRVIVHYMCRQALLHYLATRAPAVSRGALQLFLSAADRLTDDDEDAHSASRLMPILRVNAEQIDALLASITVCDPAIGCGAFALGMLQAIVRARMALTPMLQKSSTASRFGRRSASALKRHAIVHSIYGMDEDHGAVALARLRLWFSLAAEAEPDHQVPLAIDDKIRQGNSLRDDLDSARGPWRLHFGDLLTRRGGFDVIITNPPYVRIQELTQQRPRSAKQFKTSYASAARGHYDLYLLFTELALRLLAGDGAAAFILPHKFFNAKYGKGLRRALSAGQHVEHIVYFGDHQVFDGATSYVCLLLLTKQPSPSFRYVKVEDLDRWFASYQGIAARLPAELLTEGNWNIVIGRGALLHARLAAMPKKLRHVARRIFQGVKTSADKIYIVDGRGQSGPNVRIFCHQNEREYLLEPQLLHPLIKGGDSRAYVMQATERLILFPYVVRQGEGATLISDQEMRSAYPRTWQYLRDHRAVLRAREGGKMAHAGWYGYGRSQALDVMALPKIFTPDLAPSAAFSLDPTGACFFTGGAAGGYGILPAEGESCPYLLGLLNSQVLDWFLRQSTTPMKGGWWSYEARYIRELPIPESTLQQRSILEQLVDQRLRLRRGEGDGITKSSTVNSLSRYLEAWVNALVYELFFPDSLHRAELHFFRLAEAALTQPFVRFIIEKSAGRDALRKSLRTLSTIDEVRIIEG